MRTDAEIIICLHSLLQQDQARTVVSAELAQRMSLSRATMHHRVEKLMQLGLVAKTCNKRIYLTDKGVADAIRLQDQHHAIKTFFEKSCGLISAEAEKCAVVLVAALSDETRSQVCMVMGDLG
ncbi:hypothetical protein LJC74_01405 [Eubacteriales bacterium OttesenSCG-928-A19]|nr:hypothetical protein [Eubacteriales bacterium OttesenSCG-928-A19]